MKILVFWIGIIIILAAIPFIVAQNYGYIEPMILKIGNSSNSVAIPLGVLFFGIFLSVKGILPSKKVGSY